MKNILVTIALMAFAITRGSGVYADKGTRESSAESIVACQTTGPNLYIVTAMSLPAVTNTE